MSFWHGKPGRLPPAALILFGAIFALPFIMLALPRDWHGSRDYEQPRYETTWRILAGDASAEPTAGMTIGRDGFGTVRSAPQVEAIEPLQNELRGVWYENTVASDVARFARAFPQRRWLNPPADGAMICTMEGLPVWNGRLELQNGCLILVDANGGPDTLAMLNGANLFRDPQNYLAVGLQDGPAAYRLRVGEDGGVFTGFGCSKPDYLPAPATLARQCGIKRMINLSDVRREMQCSAETLDRMMDERKRQLAEYRMAPKRPGPCPTGQNGQATPPCPAMLLPPPPPRPSYSTSGGVCQVPDEFYQQLVAVQPPQSSSTQP